MRNDRHDQAGRENPSFPGGTTLRAIELFAGAGGLALGVAQAGFRHALLVEYDADACATLRQNAELLGCHESAILETDSRQVDYSAYGPCDLVVGGPPCQPFSLGGKHSGPKDRRDMFPEAIRAVRELRPKAFLFENVKGLLRKPFAPYLRYIILQLRFPSLVRDEHEDWNAHCERLDRALGGEVREDRQYAVSVRLLNAADFGVPQRRERVFIVGLRQDLGLQWSFPRPTHSLAALLYDQQETGDYWRRHGLSEPAKKKPQLTLAPAERPWQTVRDAIGRLVPPAPLVDKVDGLLVEGARTYKGHTGSRLDEPSKTLKAGDHGVPGGENTVVTDGGSVRYLTVRESARIQTFPDTYGFAGSWTERMRQLGNAVPPVLARAVASHLASLLALADEANWPAQALAAASSMALSR